MAEEERNNGRVTLAVIQQEIKHLREDVNKMNENNRAILKDHEGRLRDVEKNSPRGDILAVATAIASGVAATLLRNQ